MSELEKQEEKTQLVESCAICSESFAMGTVHQCAPQASVSSAEKSNTLDFEPPVPDGKEEGTQTVQQRAEPEIRKRSLRQDLHRHDQQQAQSTATASSTVAYASFWRRLWSMVLDVCIFAGVIGILFFICASVYVIKAIYAPSSSNLIWDAMLYNATFLGIFGYVGYAFGWWAYQAGFECSKWQGTLGMRMAGIVSTTREFKRMSFFHAVGRVIVENIAHSLVPMLFLVPTGIVAILLKDVFKLKFFDTPLYAWMILPVALLFYAGIYVPIFKRKSLTIVDLVARRLQIRVNRSALSTGEKVERILRTFTYLLTPYLVPLLFYLTVPAWEVPFLNAAVVRVVLIIFAVFHLTGAPFACLARVWRQWVAIWMIYVVSISTFYTFGPALWMLIRRIADVHPPAALPVLYIVSFITVALLGLITTPGLLSKLTRRFAGGVQLKTN